MIESPQVAAARAQTVPLRLGKSESLELTASDQVVQIGSNRSFFKVASLSSGAQQAVRIQVASKCDCVGFRKFMFVPLIVVIDQDGQNVPLPPAKFESKAADMANPLRLIATWTFLVRSPGNHRILIAADNAYNGKSVATAKGSNIHGGLLPALIAIDVKAVAVGDFVLLANTPETPPPAVRAP